MTKVGEVYEDGPLALVFLLLRPLFCLTALVFANPTRHYLIQHSEMSNSTPPGRQRKLAATILRNVIPDFLLAIGSFYLSCQGQRC